MVLIPTSTICMLIFFYLFIYIGIDMDKFYVKMVIAMLLVVAALMMLFIHIKNLKFEKIDTNIGNINE